MRCYRGSTIHNGCLFDVEFDKCKRPGRNPELERLCIAFFVELILSENFSIAYHCYCLIIFPMEALY